MKPCSADHLRCERSSRESRDAVWPRLEMLSLLLQPTLAGSLSTNTRLELTMRRAESAGRVCHRIGRTPNCLRDNRSASNTKAFPSLVRSNDQISALAETCSHLGGPLSEANANETTVTCPWHGSRFALKGGSVLDGPTVHPKQCFETRTLNGKIEIRSLQQTRRRGLEPRTTIQPQPSSRIVITCY
jgi:nitrite reductase/ring-hydroxylating ferredoxin subunit